MTLFGEPDGESSTVLQTSRPVFGLNLKKQALSWLESFMFAALATVPCASFYAILSQSSIGAVTLHRG
jgi:hypothetical protein